MADESRPTGNPFADPPSARTPARRLRGRLAAPVTIVTSGPPEAPAGLTVSSLVVAEGEPSLMYLLVGATTDLFYALGESSRCVVHVCETAHRGPADVFAGLRPSPGGTFAAVEYEASDYGPVLAAIPNRAYCSVRSMVEESYSVMVKATIDAVAGAALDDPLVHFRGRYRAVDRA